MSFQILNQKSKMFMLPGISGILKPRGKGLKRGSNKRIKSKKAVKGAAVPSTFTPPQWEEKVFSVLLCLPSYHRRPAAIFALLYMAWWSAQGPVGVRTTPMRPQFMRDISSLHAESSWLFGATGPVCAQFLLRGTWRDVLLGTISVAGPLNLASRWRKLQVVGPGQWSMVFCFLF